NVDGCTTSGASLAHLFPSIAGLFRSDGCEISDAPPTVARSSHPLARDTERPVASRGKARERRPVGRHRAAAIERVDVSDAVAFKRPFEFTIDVKIVYGS
ncbi:hypothetical protein Trydic_g14518, partial [Trypoxylus dichotomus]